MVAPAKYDVGMPEIMFQEETVLTWLVLRAEIKIKVTFNSSALYEVIEKILLARKLCGEPSDCS